MLLAVAVAAAAHAPPLLKKRVTGVVVDAGGRPAPNVTVRLASASKTAGPAILEPGGSKTGDAVIGVPGASPLQKAPGDLRPGEKLAKPPVTTDSNGRFLFTEVPDGKYVILAGTGQSSARAGVFVAGEIDPAPVTIQLPPPK